MMRKHVASQPQAIPDFSISGSDKISKSLFKIMQSYIGTGYSKLKKKRWLEYGHLTVMVRVRFQKTVVVQE